MPRRLQLLILGAAAWWGPALALVSAAAGDPAPASPPLAIRLEAGLVYSHAGGQELQLDVIRPADTTPVRRPAVVYFHGGGWQAGKRQDAHRMLRFLAAQGFVGVTVSYRFAPAFPWPAQVHDAKTAVRYVRSHANEWGIDPARIAAAGDSAGGYLALMLGVTQPADGLEGGGEWSEVSSRVQAVVSYYSAADFTVRLAPAQPATAEETKRQAELEALFQAYYKKSGRQVLADWSGTDNPDDPVWRRLSPVTYIDAGDAPVLILHGDADVVVPVAQARLLDRALGAVGVPHELVVVPGGDHGLRPDPLASTGPAVLTFLRRWLNPPAPETSQPSAVATPPASSGPPAGAPSKDKPAATVCPPPSQAEVRYGPRPRQVLDFWAAEKTGGRPTALVVYIHGGGFVAGDKTQVRGLRLVPQCLAEGVSVAAINYPFVDATTALSDVLPACARAVQFLRAEAARFGLDPRRIASCGHSAGAGTSLWLAFHDDLADPGAADPVLRQSSRLACAVSWDGQYTYDLRNWGEVFGEEARARFGGKYNSPALYGLATEAEMEGEEGRRRRAACDFYAMISPDDPPVFVGAGLPTMALDSVGQYLHHPRHSQLIYERCRERGVGVVARIPALGIAPTAEPRYGEAFMFAHLKAP